MRVVALILFALFVSPSPAWVQTRKPASLNELVSYMGADREQILYAGAKAEGKLMWYTSLAGGSYKALIAAFEAKYPGVKIVVYRAGGADLYVRVTEEYKAGRNLVDTIETTEGNLMFMRDSQLLQPYNSPVLKAYPEDAKEAAGNGLYYWALARESYIGFTYNKNLLPAAAVPKNFDGLLHPDLKGKMGIAFGRSVGQQGHQHEMIKAKGEEFVKKLKEQQIRLYSLDRAALVNVIASGEVVASPAIFCRAIHGSRRRKVRRSNGCRWILCPTTSAARPSRSGPPIPMARFSWLSDLALLLSSSLHMFSSLILFLTLSPHWLHSVMASFN